MKFLCLPYKYELKLTLSFNQKIQKFSDKNLLPFKSYGKKTIFFKWDSQVPSGPKGLRHVQINSSVLMNVAVGKNLLKVKYISIYMNYIQIQLGL